MHNKLLTLWVVGLLLVGGTTAEAKARRSQTRAQSRSQILRQQQSLVIALTIQAIKAKIIAREAERAKLLKRYKRSSPQVRRLDRMLSDLVTQLMELQRKQLELQNPSQIGFMLCRLSS